MFGILWAAAVAVSVPITRPRPLNASAWIASEDYPWGAIQQRSEGVVSISLAVGPGGAVESCAVTRSSGSELLDGTTCALIKMRARFEPARDRLNRPSTADYVQNVRWQMPADTSNTDGLQILALLQQDGGIRLAIDADIDAAGTVSACTVDASRGFSSEIANLCAGVRGKALPERPELVRNKHVAVRASVVMTDLPAPAK